MDRWQYLLLLAGCLIVTAPLEFLGSGVYRRPRTLGIALLPAAAFIGWDLLAIATNIWHFSPRYLLGVWLPGAIPIEELLFFAVVPVCGLLTFAAVERLLGIVSDMRHGRRDATEGTAK
ncbi:lycopene cyclase domain-containing protein [Nocardia pseudobrasiliensis]|uniref:Lycopene cyclase domain-containing protein n=1 Tax=Nocardia pseudobrasiliensis TaxID=45979 RepID=A0A370HPX6_9NOCA|nr:lycopene cyclase domain-containing protein [Nocardia pseudobrasiliensis]RDI60548.1 lycopene cyclase domain-containing protein [Nocardia pseudobrasiliensis]